MVYEILVAALLVIAMIALGCFMLWEGIVNGEFMMGFFGIIIILFGIVTGVWFLHDSKEDPTFFMRTIEISEIHQIDTLFMNGEPIKYTIHCK